MPLVANTTTRELIPEGLHEAICYGVVDIGTHYAERWDKWQRKVVLMFELPKERYDYEDNEGNKRNVCRVISQTYSLSLDTRANLFRDLSSWRGKKLTPIEIGTFDILKVIGKACQIQIEHNTNEHGTFMNIGVIVPYAKGSVPPSKTENELLTFSFQDFAENVVPNIPKHIPEWLSKKIFDSREWVELKKRVHDNAMEPEKVNWDADDLPSDDGDDSFGAVEGDDLPF